MNSADQRLWMAVALTRALVQADRRRRADVQRLLAARLRDAHRQRAALHQRGLHALVDGNKRLAWLATYVFLDINGRRVTATNDDVVEFVVAVAAGELDDVSAIAARLREWAPGEKN